MKGVYRSTVVGVHDPLGLEVGDGTSSKRNRCGASCARSTSEHRGYTQSCADSVEPFSPTELAIEVGAVDRAGLAVVVVVFGAAFY